MAMNQNEEFRYLVLAIQREGNRVFAAALRPLGLTPSQSEILRILAERAPLSLAELGGLLICETGGSPSRLVDRLVAMGLVTRDQGPDRRSISLGLTAKGSELARGVTVAETRLYEAIAPLLAGQRMEETLQTLRTVADAFPAGEALARRRSR